MRAKSKPPGGFKLSPEIVESLKYKRGFRTPRSFAYEQSVLVSVQIVHVRDDFRLQ